MSKTRQQPSYRPVAAMNLLGAVAAGALAIASAACGEVSEQAPDAAGTTADPDAGRGGGDVDASDVDATAGDPDATARDPDASLEDPDAAVADAQPEQVCPPNEALRCDGDDLVSCNGDGSGEVSSACALGCNSSQVRCNDIDPSNSLASFLDQTAEEPELFIVEATTIDTDTGEITVGGDAQTVPSAVTGGSSSAPQVRVFMVGGLTTGAKITVVGSNALAIVSDGDIQIEGELSVSARGSTAGPGEFTVAACVGGNVVEKAQTIPGAGGGGFGSPGGKGGDATNQGTAIGGDGGGTVGSSFLIPLRGGCNSGAFGSDLRGRGGGAMQLVSRTRIVVKGGGGILSANGSSRSGGGSGGGILLEAPTVEVAGIVAANGGAGAGGGFIPVAGDPGLNSDQPAQGGSGADSNAGDGGNGAARSFFAKPGQNIDQSNLVFAGHGGAGAGRIRINTSSGGFASSGIVSPTPSTGTIEVR